MGSLYQSGRRVSSSVAENLAAVREMTDIGMDVVLRELRLGNGQPAAAFFIDGLVDNDMLGRDFFAPLTKAKQAGNYSSRQLMEGVLTLGEIRSFDDLDQVMAAVLQGLTALFIEGDEHALCVQAINWQQRSVEEPGTDTVIRGPREGFIESMRVNVSLLRRKVHHPDLRVESVRLGRYSQTDAAVVYISSIVNQGVLAELKRRLERIDIDALLDSGAVEQLIQDSPYSIFPTVGSTEKPDIAAARMLEGRVTLLLDGSPIALTLPLLFIEGLHSPEDSYTRFYYATWVRLVRVAGFLISLYLPAFFVAAACWHQQIIPFKLLLTMAAAEAETPFSTGVSLLLLGLAYEILREAGIRLPKPTGQAISIVGAIVMGDAAVNANLISAPVLIVLALTVVASFVSSLYADASALLRLGLLLLAWMLGFFGLLLGTLFLLLYLCSLESFGVPYFAPLAPLDRRGLRDAALRFPLWLLPFRPPQLSRNRRRLGWTRPASQGDEHGDGQRSTLS